jgi:hypothetical protein
VNGRTYWADDVCNMADTCAACRPKIKYLLARCDVDVVEATKHTRGKLAPERIPYTVLGLRFGFAARVDRYALLAVDGLSWDEVLGHEHVLLALREEDARVPMRFEHDVGTTPAAATAAAAASTSAAAAAASATTTRCAATASASAALDTSAACSTAWLDSAS